MKTLLVTLCLGLVAFAEATEKKIDALPVGGVRISQAGNQAIARHILVTLRRTVEGDPDVVVRGFFLKGAAPKYQIALQEEHFISLPLSRDHEEWFSANALGKTITKAWVVGVYSRGNLIGVKGSLHEAEVWLRAQAAALKPSL